MKQKGFTLIELLVVVAIIGTLAAIGVLAYDGYTSNAKVSAAKSNCKTVIKYLRNEIIKCQAGVGPWLNYHPNCPSSHVDYYIIFNKWRNCTDMATYAFPRMKNPFGRIHPFTKSDHPVGCRGAWSEPGEIDITPMQISGKHYLQVICPCAEKRDGTNNKLVCVRNKYATENDPNCIREWIQIE